MLVGKPQEALLCELFTPKYAAHWKRIGILLGISDNALQKIADDAQSTNECCNELWRVWVSQYINASWKSMSRVIDIISVTDLLQKVYKNERNIDRVETWTSHRPEQVAKVSVICFNGRHATLKQVEDIAKAMHSGKLTGQQLSAYNISNCKITNCISDIFAPNPSQDKNAMPNFVLIEGAPGFGKTILSREIAFQWACENLLHDKHFLFLLHLRDLQILQIKSLDQLICYVSKLTLKNEVVKSTVDYMERNLGQNCTIIFDGYDEISEKFKKDSLIAKIIRHDILPLCHLVITSRPSASTDLYGIIDRRIEVIGFTKDDRNEYIDKNLQENEAEKFQEYLQNNSFISDLCYIPLNMTILLNFFKELISPNNPILLKTQTEIYSQFIYKTIAHFISQKKKKTVAIRSPDDLKMPFKQHFNLLCKFAFDLLGSEMVLFGEVDMQKYISKKAITNWGTLGLLRETNYYSIEDNKTKRSYCFLHLSMQECLAAHYIAKDAENSFLRKYFWDSHYVNAGIMYIGLTKGKSSAFKNFISSHSQAPGKQFEIDKAILSDKFKKLHLFLCFLEARNDKLSEQLQVDEILFNNTIDLSNNVLQQKDSIHTLSFFLLRSTCKHWEKINLSNSCLNDESLESFSKFSNSKIDDAHVSIDTLDLSHNNLTPDSADAMISLISCFKIKNTIVSDSVAEVKTFKGSLLSNVAKVGKTTLSSTGRSSHFLINFKLIDMNINFLNQLEYKIQLYAWNTNAPLSIISILAVKCDTLNIYEENLSDEKISDIVSKLKMISKDKGSNITYVLQSTNKIIAYGADFYQISQSFKNDSFYKHTSNWKIVNMRQCNIGEQNLNEFSQFFNKYNIEYLDTLDFSECGLRALSISAVLEILKCCIVKNLIISDHSICNKALCTLIVNEITLESKVLNFRMNIPMMMSINEFNCLFFINIDFYDAVINDYDCVYSQLFFSNIGLHEINIKSILKLCRNNKSQVNLFEMNTTDEIINDILTELEQFKDNVYVLASSTRLIAFNAKHKQILDAVDNSSALTTLKLINCEISLSKLYPLDKLLSNSSHNWDLIDLSGCNIKDEGCLSLYEYLTTNKNQIHIEVLNLSSNSLRSDSVIITLKIFEHCIIKTLIISRNEIPLYMFNIALEEHLLVDRCFLNFKYKVPLMVYESTSHHSYEVCNVYTFQSSSDMGDLSQIYKGNILWNLYHVQSDHEYCFSSIFSISLTTDEMIVHVLVEGVMDEKISDMITECCKLKYGKGRKLAKVDFSRIAITDNTCKILCNSLFSNTSTLNLIEQLDFSSSCRFSMTCAPIIMELFQCCVIKHLVLPNREILDKISETLLKDYHTEKIIVNFSKKIPFTVNIETEVEEEGEDGISYSIIANTYLQDYEITANLFNHYENEVINQITTSHTFILLDCLQSNELNTILQILYTKASYIKICIFELRLTNNVLEESINHLRMLKKEIYRDRLRYVLASNTKIVAYNAKRFQILQALQIKVNICDLEIIHCILSKGNLKLMALTLIGQLNSLKNIKVIACKIKDKDFFEFCDVLSDFRKATRISLKTMDFSHNLLTSSSIGTILKLLKCSVIEELIVSNNSIDDTALTDAIYQLARFKWSKFCNASSGTPLVIINMLASKPCKLSTDRKRCATLFHMNHKIDNHLLLMHHSQAKRMYFMNSLVSFGNLRTNLSILYQCLSSAIKVVVYEKNLSDEVIHEAATCLNKGSHVLINYILASKTKLLARGSTYHQIASLLESNPLITTLQLTNFAMQFPCECRFIRTLTNTYRKWESIDLSGCNISNDGCLSLQRCFVLSKSTIRHLNFMHNKLSSTSAAAIANIILNCDVKKIKISRNKLQPIQIINALSCLTANVSCCEIINGDSTAIVVSNIDPKFLPNQLWSSNCNNIQLCIMHYFQFSHVYSILSSLHCIELSKVILYNNCLTLEEIGSVINKLSTTHICIQEAYIQYNSKFIDYSSTSLMTNLLEIIKDNSISSPFSSLTFSNLDSKYNKICVYDYKIIFNSVENTLSKLIQHQISITLVAIKLSNCCITYDIAKKLAYFINKALRLNFFELSYIHIQELDLKVIFLALQSTKSLIFFIIRSIDCFIEGTAENIASIIVRNQSIKYLEISNCDMKQLSLMTIAESIKKLRQLINLSLSGIPLTYESLVFALKDKSTLKELNLSHCRLQNPEISCISSTLKDARLTSINLSHNNISNYAIARLATLLLDPLISKIEMSECNLQEFGMSCIAKILKSHSFIKYLNFCGNRITDFLAMELSAGIHRNPFIMNLDLSNCSLQEMGTVEILTSLKKRARHLKLLKISSIVSTAETVCLFEHVLDNCKSIEHLTLVGCNCENVFNAVSKKTSTLQFLDISSSTISFNNLMSVIANNTTIKHLNISNCDIQGETDVNDNNLLGLFLEYFNLGGNKITTAFANLISNLISANYKLKHLDIASCEVQESELIKITNSLTLLTTLKHLNYSNIVISTQVASILSKVIANNVHLEHVDISLCELTETTFSPIANALKQVQVLKHFKMNFNDITSTSIINPILPHSSTEKAGNASIPPVQCKSITKTSDKTKLSTHVNTDKNNAILVETSKVTPLYATIAKSYKSPDTNIYMTTKQMKRDCSTSNYKLSAHSNTDENATYSVETVETGNVGPVYATIQKSKSLDTHIYMTTKIKCDCSSSIYKDTSTTDSKDAISNDSISIAYNQKDFTPINNDSVCLASEKTAHKCLSSTNEVTISSSNTSIFYIPKSFDESDNKSVDMTDGEVTPPVSLVNHDMLSLVDCNESTDTGDHNGLSFVEDEMMPLCSPDEEEELLANLPSDTDGDFDAWSIAANKTMLQHSNNCSSYNNSFSQASLSHHPNNMTEDDHETISIAADEITIQNSGKMSETISRNVDILAADDMFTKSCMILKSSLHGHGYESVLTDDVTSNCLKKQSKDLAADAPENVLSTTETIDYDDLCLVTERITGHTSFDGYPSKDVDDTMSKAVSNTKLQNSNKMSENALTNIVPNVTTTEGCRNIENLENFESLLEHQEVVIIDDRTANYVNRKSQNLLLIKDGLEPILSATDETLKHNENASKDVDDVTSIASSERVLQHSDKMAENVSIHVDDILEASDKFTYGHRNSENSATDCGYETDDCTSSCVTGNSEHLLTNNCGDVLLANGGKRKLNCCSGNVSTSSYNSVPKTDQRQPSINDQKNSLNHASILKQTVQIRSKCGCTLQDLNENVVSEETKTYSTDIINSNHKNITIFDNRTENTSADKSDSLLNRGKKTAEHASITISGFTLANDYDDIVTTAENITSGSENNLKHEKSGTRAKDLNENVFGEVAQNCSSNINSDDIIMRPRCERSRSISKDLNKNVVPELNSSDVHSNYTNVSSFINRVEDTTTHDYDTLIKRDETTADHNSTTISKSTSTNQNDDNMSITDSDISGLEITSVDNHQYENVPLTSNSVAIVKITEVITCSCFLECLEISDCRLSDPQVATIAIALSKASTLKHLNLSNNQIVKDSTAHKIAIVIKSNLSLKNINLSNCHLQENGIIIIAKAIARLTSVGSIDLSKNKISFNSIKSVAAAITGNFLLERLNLRQCFNYDNSQIDTEGVNNILLALTKLTSMKHLDLHSNYINHTTSKLLPMVISSNNKSLCHLDLTGCKLRPTQFNIEAIAKKLQSTFTLKYLTLSYNVVTNEAAHEIALAVSNNLSLQHLALSNCKMEERGLMDVAESLLNVSSLKHLDLSYSRITDKVAATLASSIAKNTLLLYLDLKYCTWQNDGFARMHKVISELPMLKKLMFDY